ncbi:MAG: hypothetical protein F2621_06065 [Actinobacteria bacterium]|nr:hypothetical protein [Actinomycetota bacterium]MTA33341.1 hypothetical protein [Actinomycetota bacterium]
MASQKRPVVRRVLWVLAGIVLVTGGFAAWLVAPIVMASPQGFSGQELGVQGYPTSVEATGDDGRTRVLSATLENSDDRELDRLIAGDRIVVTGTGYNANFGIYVAICAIPHALNEKPGPCLGGVPATTPGELGEVGAIEYAPSNWINDQWAWRLFGARSFDDRGHGAFTAYIEVPGFGDENVDCRERACGLYTRNDHTALDDRVQDVYLPVDFMG